MLDRFIHQALPYLCITAGLELVLLVHSVLAWVLGGVTFMFGAYLWIRYNQAKAAAYKASLPKFLYEAAPFAYIFAGTLCMLTFMHYQGEQMLPFTLVGAMLFYFAGFGSWLLRSIRRE